MLPKILAWLAVPMLFGVVYAETCENVEFASGAAIAYPAIALASRTSGKATTLIHLDGLGNFVSVNVLNPVPPLLEQQTKANALSLRFRFSGNINHVITAWSLSTDCYRVKPSLAICE
jgi:hypothetical protein